MVSVIASSTVALAGAPSRLTKPAIPHIYGVVSLADGERPGEVLPDYTGAVKTRLFAALLWLAGCLAPAPASAEWRRLDSPNFIVIGDASERELRNIAVQFEGFRETLGRVLSAKVTATAVPTVVVVFPNDRAYTPYKPLYNGKPMDVGGVFYSGHDANYITLLNDGREGRLRVIFHEYAHLMISNVVMNLPTWLDEGLAEYYSTYDATADGREAVIGRPVSSHLQRLSEERLLPINDLINVNQQSPMYNEGERRSVFYAQSWALTHMLLLGEPSRLNELAAFIGAVQRGVPTAEAWRQAFGVADLDKALRQYLRASTFRAYRFKFAEALARVSAAARSMSQADTSAFLAVLRVRQGRLDEAAALADGILQMDNAHAYGNVAKAQVESARGERDAAAARLTTLKPPEDWFVRYAAGTTLTDNLGGEFIDVPADRVKAARAHLAGGGQGREIPNVLADLARLDLLVPKGASSDTRVAIERARALAPGRDDYAILHARVVAELGDFTLARSVLTPMMTPERPEYVRHNANVVMRYVMRLEERQRSMSGPPSAPSRPTGGADHDRAGAGAEATSMKPVFRVVEPGEERLEGTLERIACPTRGPVLFHVRTATGVETLQAPKFESVVFVTFRDDLSGGITCGPLKEPMRVYVTWRPSTGATLRTVIAVEFLPK